MANESGSRATTLRVTASTLTAWRALQCANLAFHFHGASLFLFLWLLKPNDWPKIASFICRNVLCHSRRDLGGELDCFVAGRYVNNQTSDDPPSMRPCVLRLSVTQPALTNSLFTHEREKMFGMLDYRAHKLYRLLVLPVQIGARIMFFVVTFIAAWIGHQTGYGFWVEAIIAYVIMEAILFGLGLFLLFLDWMFLSIFFWFVDVIPSKGESDEEAREIVQKGRIVWLSRKLAWDITNWTDADSRSLVSLMNWRARLFFDARQRFERRLSNLKRYVHETGFQIGDLSSSEAEAIGGDPPSKLETVIVHPQYFNSILGAAIILTALLMVK